jgi:hypothetical protein
MRIFVATILYRILETWWLFPQSDANQLRASRPPARP